MTKAKTKAKAKAIRMPGKERPAASRLVIQKPLPTKPHHRNTGKDTKPSAGQPRGLGPGSLRKARPRRSNYNLTTHPEILNIRQNSDNSNHAMPRDPAAR
jgi:hypothetical protein